MSPETLNILNGEENKVLVKDGYVHIPSGEFMMGSNSDSKAEQPIHKVFLSGFWCATTPVTNAEFEVFIQETNYQTTAERNEGLWCRQNGVRDFHPVTWRNFANQRWDHPVVGVSWFDAEAYCNWISEKANLPFRLPTEAEWEKAARGGLEQATFPWGNESAERVGANFGHLGSSEVPRTVSVTTMPCNGFGLHIGGNVWEWVQDWFETNYYEYSPYLDPKGPETGISKVRRSGAFNNRRSFRLRVGSRNRLDPAKTFLNMGFRVVRSEVSEEQTLVSFKPIEPMISQFDKNEIVNERPSLRTVPMSDSNWDTVIQQKLDRSMPLANQIETILNIIRPNMEEDDGGIELVEIKKRTAYLRMTGTCHNCPKSIMTFQDIAGTLFKHIPILDKVEQMGFLTRD